MKSKKIFLWVTVVLLMSLVSVNSQDRAIQAPSPGGYSMLKAQGEATVPFELYRHHVIVQAEIGGKLLRLCVDTGFTAEGVILHGGPHIDDMDLEYMSKIGVGGAGGSEPVPADLAVGVGVIFPGLELTNQTCIVMPYDSIRAVAFEGEDGYIGGSLFNNFVVTLDYDKMTLTVTEPEKFDYSGSGEILPAGWLHDGAPTISATADLPEGKAVSLQLVVDLGASHALSLNVKGHEDITLPEKRIEYSLGMGILGEELGYIGRVQALHLGKYTLDHVITAFSDSEHLVQIEGEGNLGCVALQRFLVIFDYGRRRMILEPNSRFNEPFEFNMSGLALRRMGDGTFRIDRIVPDSPGSEAGLEKGDVVVEINGRSPTQYNRDEVTELLQQEGERLHLTISRDGTMMHVTITLRRLI